MVDRAHAGPREIPLAREPDLRTCGRSRAVAAGMHPGAHRGRGGAAAVCDAGANRAARRAARHSRRASPRGVPAGGTPRGGRGARAAGDARPVNESRVCVVLPTYNERENVPQIVPAILAASPAVDLLVVDDNSPDGTGALADEIAARDSRVRVLHRPRKEGLGRAYLAGFAEVLRGGFKVVEVPITFVDRRVGKSKMSRRIVAEALWMVWKIRFDRAANAG